MALFEVQFIPPTASFFSYSLPPLAHTNLKQTQTPLSYLNTKHPLHLSGNYTSYMKHSFANLNRQTNVYTKMSHDVSACSLLDTFNNFMKK